MALSRVARIKPLIRPASGFLRHSPRHLATPPLNFIYKNRLACTSQIPGQDRPRLGAVSFQHRFGSAINRHVHLHASVADGVLRGQFRDPRHLFPDELASLQNKAENTRPVPLPVPVPDLVRAGGSTGDMSFSANPQARLRG